MKKLKLKRIHSEDEYNEIDFEKGGVFLDSLQEFIIRLNLDGAQKSSIAAKGKRYSNRVYNFLYFDDPKESYITKKRRLNEFRDGESIRFHNKSIDLIIIFLQEKIKLIFYCNERNKIKVIDALSKFINLEE